jgi:hypothetical protein
VHSPSTTRRVLFVSPHYPPDSSAASHRARILVPHLARYGWETVVLTVDPDTIEGRIDPELLSSIPVHVRVVRAPAVPVRRARVAGVGDLGIRALRGLYVEGRRLLAREPFDAVLITTYPVYPAWLGPRFKAMSGARFVLDFQDPWVGAWGRTVGPGGRPDLRSRLSRRVAVALERSIVPQADALVAVSSGTLDELATRVPVVRTLPRMELPIGWEPADFAHARTIAPRREHATVTLSYVGTLLPAGYDVVRALFNGTSQLLERHSNARLRLRFVGTSNQTKYDGAPLLSELVPGDLRAIVDEQPERVAYLEAIRLLSQSDVVLVVGTREPHYTASKVYPALASGRPVFALVHENSQATPVLRNAAGVTLVTFDASTTASELANRVSAGLCEALTFVGRGPFDRSNVLDAFRGESLACRLARLLDDVAAPTRTEVHA